MDRNEERRDLRSATAPTLTDTGVVLFAPFALREEELRQVVRDRGRKQRIHFNLRSLVVKYILDLPLISFLLLLQNGQTERFI